MSHVDSAISLRRLTWLVLVGCLAVVLATAAVVVSPRLRQTLGVGQGSPAYRVGQRIDTPPETYAGALYTLILFARESCAACQGAQPFLADVVRQLEGSRVAVSVLTPADKRDQQVAYVRGLGLSEARLHPAALRQFKVRVVPTAVLVDQAGVILGLSEGGGDPLHALASQVLSKAH